MRTRGKTLGGKPNRTAKSSILYSGRVRDLVKDSADLKNEITKKSFWTYTTAEAGIGMPYSKSPHAMHAAKPRTISKG
jgi:hypothetical protein